MKIRNIFYLSSVFFLTLSCSEKEAVKKEIEKPAVTIVIQPFKDLEPDTVDKITEGIKKVYPNVKVLSAIDFPESTYYKERNRYRADSIIKFLNS